MTFWNVFWILIIFVPLTLLWAMTLWDLFTRPAMSGIARALWLLAVLVFPVLGSLVYLVVHGNSPAGVGDVSTGGSLSGGAARPPV